MGFQVSSETAKATTRAGLVAGALSESNRGRKFWDKFLDGVATIVQAADRFSREKARIESNNDLSPAGRMKEIRGVQQKEAAEIRAALLAATSGIEGHITSLRRVPEHKTDAARLLAFFEGKEVLADVMGEDPVHVRVRFDFGPNGGADANDPAMGLLDSPIFANRLAKHIGPDGLEVIEAARRGRDDASHPDISVLRDVLDGYKSVAAEALKDVGATSDAEPQFIR